MLHIRDSKCVCCKISLRRHVQTLCVIDFMFLICSTYYTSVVLANVIHLLERGKPNSIPPISTKDDLTTVAIDFSSTPATLKRLSNIQNVVLYKPDMRIVAAIISSSLQIFLHAIQILLILALLYAIHKNILSYCKIWFTATVLLSIIITISLVVNLSGKYFIVPTVITALYLAYKCYMLWIVKLYTKRLVLYLIHYRQGNDKDLEDTRL